MIDPTSPIRIARPSGDLPAAERFYVHGLGLDVLYRGAAATPDEHDLLMLGWREASWHLELVGGANLTTPPAPRPDELLVVYLSGPIDPEVVTRLEQAGGHRVSQGPYWDRWGITIEDPDGYRLVLSTRAWTNA